ncbi:hypothetical protein [Paenibacillus sp. FSL K6-2524]|uniref:hypothetical protein n=1 Tax=Paenibacillus sp. FSL K6-2524 TaxID=2954516 RepID=UPI0030F6ADD5
MSEQLLQQILQKLDNIEVEQQSMKSDMQSMKSDMQSMKSDILSLKGTQGLMQIQLNETNTIVRAIRDRQDETDAKLDALSMDVHKLHGELIFLKEGQERHERILERLSLRSIEHEAEISGLRRAK